MMSTFFEAVLLLLYDDAACFDWLMIYIDSWQYTRSEENQVLVSYDNTCTVETPPPNQSPIINTTYTPFLKPPLYPFL